MAIKFYWCSDFNPSLRYSMLGLDTCAKRKSRNTDVMKIEKKKDTLYR